MISHTSVRRVAAIAGATLGIAFAAMLPADALTADGDRTGCTSTASSAAIRGAMFVDRPDIATELGLTGTANVRVDLDANGNVAKTSLASSSGHDILDNEALAEARNYRYVAETQDCAGVGGSYIVVIDFAS